MKKPKHPKHADFSQLARSVVQAATNEADEKPVEDANESAAVKRGRLGGAKGGKARAEKLSKHKRIEIAKKAAAVRWKRATK